jgi:hypothetical protein
MEDMAPHWCPYCLLKKQDWKECNHRKGEPRTVENIIETVELNNITENTPTNPKYRGVKSRPLLDFVPVGNYFLSLLHIWMGIFNDSDDMFMLQVHLLTCSNDEIELRNRLPALVKAVERATQRSKEFNNGEQGKKLKRFLGRLRRGLPLNDGDRADMDELAALKKQIVAEKNAATNAEKDVKDKITNFVSEAKKDLNGVYHAIQNHWKRLGKSKAAYHGGSWNGSI